VVVGDGPDLALLEALVDELKIRDHVSLVGRRDDMPGVYASLDIMVSSSRQEGLPMAILEGMASGLPLVATSVGAVPSVVLNDRTGILVPPEDTDSLAAGITKLLHDAELRRCLGAGARRLIEEEFSAERMMAEYLRVYDKAMTSVRAAIAENKAKKVGK
jgi:glycosyltransferase involved in cell wall biosynthesis